MSIFSGSRYSRGLVGSVVDSSGRSNRTVFRGSTARSLKVSKYYITVSGDRLDFLARRIYGRDDLWWLIADANDDTLLVDPLPVGVALRIPDVPDDV